MDELLEGSGSGGGITTVSLDPQRALGAYLDDHGLAALGRRMTRTGMLELVATATPGIKELLVLGQLRQLADADHTGTVVVDGSIEDEITPAFDITSIKVWRSGSCMPGASCLSSAVPGGE